jgi:hypothetical protein
MGTNKNDHLRQLTTYQRSVDPDCPVSVCNDSRFTVTGRKFIGKHESICNAPVFL